MKPKQKIISKLESELKRVANIEPEKEIHLNISYIPKYNVWTINYEGRQDEKLFIQKPSLKKALNKLIYELDFFNGYPF